MKDLILVRFGELGLKGKNRLYFQNILLNRIREALAPLGGCRCHRTHGRIFVEVPGDLSQALSRLEKVFGIVSLSPARRLPLNLAHIKEEALSQLDLARQEGGGNTFKVEARRANKSFAYNSLEINRLVGAHLLQNTKGLSVDVHEPDIRVVVEIRREAYVYARMLPGPGGLPVGTGGRAVLLLSGGIDSPVAGWLTMKRGVNILPVYFHSPPFTGERAKGKVVDLCRVLAAYGGQLPLHVVHFTQIQKALSLHCPEELGTILMRRMMMRLAQELAHRQGAQALVTGESIGQVASQTLEGLRATDAVVDLPVFRPLIGLDKVEIIELAQRIDTYKTSILPYDDCCTLFVPRRPATRPRLKQVAAAEAGLPVEELVKEALLQTEIIKVTEMGIEENKDHDGP
ncbi:MAG: tRNA 4-thiouridine(8) synthase ThiI [Firmicutes bacterium]|nr:tRNA 4-thiouridine(8) synthase ThiI [Bacillota bacterium]